jgi:membrane-bound lytic murein transglycosylase B
MALRKATAKFPRPPKRPRVRPPRLHQPTVHLTAMAAGAAIIAAFAAAAPALHGSFVGNRTPSQPAAVVGQAGNAAAGLAGIAPTDGPGTYTTFVTPPSTTVTTGPGSIATVQYNGPAGSEELASPLAADGIPVTALEAYQDAANSINASDPNCRLPWPLLAGIGRVESDHGRYGGAVLRPDGTSTKPIIGPPLNGDGTEVITDTDGGTIDGDPVYDRAVGPMQFIPSTWASYGTDGNSDGIADPFNIFDAAAAAANYLCVAGGDLSTTAGQTRAVLSYNHSTAYLDEVLALERTYASGDPTLIIPQPPVTAPTLPVTRPGHPVPPPVDPGPPLSGGTGSNPGGGSSTSAHPGPTSTAPKPGGSSSSSSTSSSAAPSASPSGHPSSSTTTGAPSTSPSTSAAPSSTSAPSSTDSSSTSAPAEPSGTATCGSTTSGTVTPAATSTDTVAAAAPQAAVTSTDATPADSTAGASTATDSPSCA